VHSFISSRLDYCNSLLFGIGIGAERIKRLQSIQNAASRLVSGTRKFDRITPVLQNVHWLPVAKRLNGRAPVLSGWCLHPSTHYQDVDSSVLLPLVSCWSPGQVPTSADVCSTVVDQQRGTPCQSLYVLTTDLPTLLAEH